MSSSLEKSAPSASDANSVLSTADYVLSISYKTTNGKPTEKAQSDFSKLVNHLQSKGVYSQVRPADDSKLLLFVKAEYSVLFNHLKSDTLKDYIYGLKSEINTENPENLSKSDKLRLVYAILTNPIHEGGAGITPGAGEWKFVEKITPLYDLNSNTRLFQEWLKKPLIDETDIVRIKEIAGEKVALYFAFARFYFLWLSIPAVLGFISHFFFHRFSIIFTILNSLWAIVFINAWKKQQAIYAISWDTKGSSKVEITRAEYVSDTIQSDPSTPLESPSFKRLIREYSFIPVAIFGGALLLSYQFICFFIEIFLGEIYQGPGKPILGLIPTVLIVVGAPYITAFYSTFITKALKWENHETQSSYNRSFTQKLFVHNFLSSYAPLLITIFFYLPYGHRANSFLPSIKSASSRFGIPVVQEHYAINTDRLTGQFAFFALTGLVVGFLTENIVPVALRLVKEKLNKSTLSETDAPEEVEFLKSARKQVASGTFDVDAEYRELTINFGYLVIFGPIWSLAPLFSLISAYIEIKGDLEKLLIESSRPIPVRVEDSEPWGTNLRFLSWLGSIISPIITSFFRSNDRYLQSAFYSYSTTAIGGGSWEAVTAALVSENVSIFLNFAVEAVFKSLTTKTERENDQKSLKIRRSYVEAYAKEPIGTKDIGTDSSDRLWSNVPSDSVIKQASSLSKLISSPSESSATSSKVEQIPSSNEKAGFQQFPNDDAKVQARASTVASKVVPATDTPKSTLGSAGSQISSTVSDVTNSASIGASIGASNVLSSASNSSSGIASNTSATISQGISNVSNGVKSSTSGVSSGISSGISGATSGISGAASGISGAASSVTKNLGLNKSNYSSKSRPLSSAGIPIATAADSKDARSVNASTPSADTVTGTSTNAVAPSSAPISASVATATGIAGGIAGSIGLNKSSSSIEEPSVSTTSSKSDKLSGDKLKKKLFSFGRKDSTKKDKKDLEKAAKSEASKLSNEIKHAPSNVAVGAKEAINDLKTPEIKSSIPSTETKSTSYTAPEIKSANVEIPSASFAAPEIKSVSVEPPSAPSTNIDLTGKKDIVPEISSSATINAPLSSSHPSASVSTPVVSELSAPEIPVAQLRSPVLSSFQQVKEKRSGANLGGFDGHSSAIDTSSTSVNEDETSGHASGLAAGAAGIVGATVGAASAAMGSTSSTGSSTNTNGGDNTTQSQKYEHDLSSSSLNGATLPPNFVFKKSANSSPEKTQPLSKQINTPSTSASSPTASEPKLKVSEPEIKSTSKEFDQPEISISKPSVNISREDISIKTPEISVPEIQASKPVVNEPSIKVNEPSIKVHDPSVKVNDPSIKVHDPSVKVSDDFTFTEPKTLDPGPIESLKTSHNGIIDAASKLTPPSLQAEFTQPQQSTSSVEGHAVHPEGYSANTTAPETIASQHQQTSTAPSAHIEGSHSGKSSSAFGLGGLSAAASKFSHRLSTHHGGDSSTEVNESHKESFLEKAEDSAKKVGTTLNDYVQLAADKVEGYSEKSDNQYVHKGNEYVQKIADKSDEYAQKQERQQEVNPQTPTKQTVEHQQSSNSNGHDGDYSIIVGGDLHDTDSLKPPKNPDSHDLHSNNSGSVSSPKKKNKFLRVVKDIVSGGSAHNTPKK